MAGPIAATGAISNPTRYGALTMGGEQFTGMWTQRSPYRDAATAYLMKKFYQGSRFDSIWDGINREISAKLTDRRRPGSAVYNNVLLRAVLSFYSWKYIQNGAEVVRVLADCIDGQILDITTFGQASLVYNKSVLTAPARFLGVGTELFIGDGVEQVKVMTGSRTWQASTNFPPGTLISNQVTGHSAYMYMALGGITMNIVATASNGSYVTVFIDPQNVPLQFANLENVQVTFGGLTAGSFLNGNTYAVHIVSSTLGILTVPVAHSAYAQIADTGSGTTGTGTTSSSRPSFPTSEYDWVTDPSGGQVWKCYGLAAENWGIAAPTKAPTITPANGTRYWQPSTTLSFLYAILDPNQNLQVVWPGSGVWKTGRSYPNWTPRTATNPNPQTIDGSIVWENLGPILAWASSTVFQDNQAIIDSNFNLQFVNSGGGGSTGATAPTWGTTIGGTTTDGALTWVCLGPGVTLTTASIQFAFSFHAIDGSVSTASPALIIQGPILGIPTTNENAPTAYLTFSGTWPADSQIDQIWIWRTPQGQSGLLFEDAVPIDPYPTGGQFYIELGIPDTSANGSGALNPFIQAPVANANDAPPAGLTGPILHLQRTWGFSGNVVYYSNGPDAIVSSSNGNTGWAPLNQISYQGAVIRIVSVTVENGGIIVFTTSGIFIILGLGTPLNPFYSTQYFAKVNLGGFNALDVYGTEIVLMEANAKVSSIAIQYPFNPQTGYTEIGFPIGDQFQTVTTGGFNTSLFNPKTAYISWNVQSTGETAMYAATNNGFWFRLSAVSPPESGYMWGTLAELLTGASAIQSVETAPGVFDLLIGPASNGSVLKRDTTGTVWADNGTAYPSWDAKGVNLLCSTGQWTEVAHISAKSMPVGARPAVSVLLGEINPSTERPWNLLEVTSPDPPSTPRSKSVFSDRYALAQNGVPDEGDCILTKFDYGAQAYGDELLDWGIFATTEDERKEEVQK
jgi:hypothetical protein